MPARFPTALAALALLATAAPAGAEPPLHDHPPTAPELDAWRVAQAEPGARRAGRRGKRERVQERIRALRAWKLTEALELDERTTARLFPLLSRYDQRGEALAAEAAKARAALRAELEAETPRAQILDRRMDELVAAQDRLHAWQKERFAAARKVLTAEQAAKMLVLLPEIDQEVRRELRRALRDGPRRPPHRRGPRGTESVDPFR